MKRLVSRAEYDAHVKARNGLCLACGKWTHGGVDHDDDQATCDHCAQERVTNPSQAKLIGVLDVIG